MHKRFFLVLAMTMLSVTFAFAQKELKVEITPLTGHFFVHTSYKILSEKPFPSNGLIVDTEAGVLLIDTGWDTDQTQQIYDWISQNLKKPVALCIITHAHDDRMAGTAFLKEKGVKVICTDLTAKLAAEQGFDLPDPVLPLDTAFRIGKVKLRIFFPGAGHTRDNIAVWFPDQKILFGGCLVKSCEAQNPGNTADANMDNWDDAISNVRQVVGKPEIIVPGHQGDFTCDALQHSLELLSQKKEK